LSSCGISRYDVYERPHVVRTTSIRAAHFARSRFLPYKILASLWQEQQQHI
jgi:hypothetical protein